MPVFIGRIGLLALTVAPIVLLRLAFLFLSIGQQYYYHRLLRRTLHRSVYESTFQYNGVSSILTARIKESYNLLEHDQYKNIIVNSLRFHIKFIT
jgi:hypothetical protein